MRKRFFRSPAGCLLIAVLFLVLLPFAYFHFASGKNKQAEVAQSSGSTVYDFQEVKREVNYEDPSRFEGDDPLLWMKAIIAIYAILSIAAVIIWALLHQGPRGSHHTPEELTRGGHMKPRPGRYDFDD